MNPNLIILIKAVVAIIAIVIELNEKERGQNGDK